METNSENWHKISTDTIFFDCWQKLKVSVMFTNSSVATGCSAGTDINHLLIAQARCLFVDKICTF